MNNRSWVGNDGRVGIVAVGKLSKSQLVSSQSSDASDGSFSNPHLHSLFGKIATVGEVPDFGFRHGGIPLDSKKKTEIGLYQRELFTACIYILSKHCLSPTTEFKWFSVIAYKRKSHSLIHIEVPLVDLKLFA